MTTPDNKPEDTIAEPVLVDGETTSTEGDDEIEEMIEDIVGLGRMWADHGIHIGKMALRNSARTLEVTSNVLERLASRVGLGKESKA